MFYGGMVWDPWLIVSQIVCLQCLYYLTLGVFMSILVGMRVSRMSLMYFFDFSTLTASTVTGWCAIISFLLSSAAGAGYVLYLIERAKKCLDFSATLYIIHLFLCIIYGGWPSSLTWWIVNLACLAWMALLGEWLCIRRELREIPITRLRSSMLSHSYIHLDEVSNNLRIGGVRSHFEGTFIFTAIFWNLYCPQLAFATSWANVVISWTFGMFSYLISNRMQMVLIVWSEMLPRIRVESKDGATAEDV